MTMPATTSKRSIPFRRHASAFAGFFNNRLYSLSVYDADKKENPNLSVSYRGRRLNLEKFRENLKREKIDRPQNRSLIIAQIDKAHVTLDCGLGGSYHSKEVVRDTRITCPCSMPLQLSPQSE